MKYKVGDKVRIKKDLVVDRTYGGDTYVKEMDDIAKDNDYVLTIGKCDYHVGEYVMDEDERNDPWHWTDEMIEGLAERNNMKYKIGDKVRIKKDLLTGGVYGDNSYVVGMDKIVRKHDYVLTIESYSLDNTQYRMEECEYNWTEEMIEGLAERKEIKNMKYKIGDKVKFRKDLVVGNKYGGLTYLDSMEKEVSANGDNVFVITHTGTDSSDVTWYDFEGLTFSYSEEMIEEPTDREKFEGWMRKLSSLKSDDRVWNAFNYCVTTEPDEEGYEDELKIISDYLFVKKMTKAEIEKELGYKIEIVEGII